MNRILSIDLARVIGMIFVMLIHSPFSEENNLPHYLLKNYIAGGAVPLFFLMAGYFSTKNMNSSNIKTLDFLKKRFYTLILPFLFWNSAILLLVFIAKLSGISSSFTGEGAYFNVEKNLSSILSALFGIGRGPIVYQFWFLRDLIVVSVTAFLLRKWIVKIPFLAWVLFFIPLPFAKSMGYYLLGYSVAENPVKLQIKKGSCLIFSIIWVGLGIGSFWGVITISAPLQQIGSALFIFLVAQILSDSSIGNRISTLGTAVFFMYATHEPLQTIIAKIWQKTALPGYGSLGCFLIIPVVTFFACWIGYIGVKKFTPRLLPILTGGR
ncbi:acyltransferase family protein [Verrucomicrobiota bacterium]